MRRPRFRPIPAVRPGRARLPRRRPCLLPVTLATFATLAALGSIGSTGCDSDDKGKAGPREGALPAPPAPSAQEPAPPPEARAPDIVVDPTYVAVGNDKVPTVDVGLADRVAVFLTGRPAIEGHSVDVVAMRNAKPGQVAAVVAALRRAKATGAGIKTEARDSSTQRLALTFDAPPQPCTTVAWIAKDAAIDVWPISGGRARRVIKGLAGPDMTLGTEAVRSAAQQCDASALVVGEDEAMTWGLLFDLATASITAPGSRAGAAFLVTAAVPGRKLSLDEK
jgi:hypothetical protein